MRILRSFDLTQIIATAEIGKDNAKTFLRRLRQAGYVICVKERENGRPGSRNTYRLVRDSGPKAPVPFQDGRIFDPNLNQTFGEMKEA